MPDNSLELAFSLTGLSEVLKGFKSVQDAAAKAGKSVDKAVARKPSPTGMGAARSGFVTGPNQRLSTYHSQLARAIVQGNTLAERDVKLAIDRTQKQLDRLKKPAFARKLDTFVRSTRVGAAGIQPLVGATADLFGGAEAVGPLGIFAAAAAEGAKALKDFTEKAAMTTATFSRLGFSTGATPGQAKMLNAVGNALKFSPDQMAGLANNVGAAASSGGIASGMAGPLGINIAPFPFGDTDNAGKLLKLIKGIRGAKTDKDAKIMADAFGADDLFATRQWTPDVYAGVVKQANATPGALNKESIQNAAALIASEGNLKTALDALDSTIGNKLAPSMTKLNNWLAKETNTVTNGINNDGVIGWAKKLHIPRMLSNPLNVLTHQKDFDFSGGRGSSPITAASMQKSEADQAKKSQDRHSDALDRHTQALNKSTQQVPGNYGNATRGDAIREGQTGLSLHKALAQREAFQLGAFWGCQSFCVNGILGFGAGGLKDWSKCWDCLPNRPAVPDPRTRSKTG